MRLSAVCSFGFETSMIHRLSKLTMDLIEHVDGGMPVRKECYA